MGESSVNAAPGAGCRSRSELDVGAGQQPAWDSPHYLELPDDPDDPEEPEALPDAPELEPPSPPAELRGSFAFLLPLASFLLWSFAVPAVVLASVVSAVALVLGAVLLGAVLLGVVELDMLPVVEPLYVDCDVWLLSELWMAELLMPFVLLLGAVDDEVVVSVRGAALFLLWSPSANAEPLANATSVVIRNIGASLRI